MDTENQKEIAEEQMIEQAFQELLNDYLATKHRKRIEIITKAFNFANQAHKGIKRRSGEPYIMHPIAVAKIVCNEIGLGSTSICAALLHDVVEDTDYTVEDIENIFGAKIAQIVDGLTKISGGIFGDRASAQAENFKKLLLTMSDDIRVILIKIADRLHNMRTLGSMLPNKQYKIAGETLYIYAPLANRLGLYKIKTELENLSFKYEHPEEYQEIEEKLNATAAERDKVFNEFTAPIREQLDKMGLKYRILARVKSIYSIWNKMQTKHVPFEEIYDLLAVRIIFEPRNIDEELNDCFDIYVSISKIYKPHPDRLRDWVSHPKANGYQALHVTLMGNNGQWIEVQIRSERMNDVAEQGFAAHWKYKEGNTSQKQSNIEGKLRCCHIHVSNPYDEMVEDDIGFPVKMAQQSYQYLQERVAEQKKKIAEQTQELKRLSYEDSLTGLYNRNKFNQDLNIEQGPNQFGIGAACFDLNGLKEVNDRNGHRAGDILICRAAECLKKGFEGKAYRIGGDEFVVIDNTLAEDDFKAAVYAVQKTMEHDGISCSVGISWRNSQYNIREQIDEADRFMYEQKREFYCQRQHDRRKYR